MLACMRIGGAVCWLLVDPHEPVFDEKLREDVAVPYGSAKAT